MNAPNKCPICGEEKGWILIDTAKKGFNTKKAIIGGVLLGGLGLIAGVKGTQKTLYTCTKCGFSHEYEGSIATKDITANPLEGYKNKGIASVWIDTINRATPECVFCGEVQELYVKKQNVGYEFICSHCLAKFRCDFTFSSKIKSTSTIIVDCGTVNKNNLAKGFCNPKVLIKDEKYIK
nr:hypothetical protein [Clostridia bacterium]